MDEVIDIYDGNLVLKGTMNREQAHFAGEWHRTFHLWLVSAVDGPAVIYQLRSPSKKSYPNLLDISAAGHLLAGETALDGLREVKEELGVSFSPDELVFLGDRIEIADEINGMKNREFQYIYMTRLDVCIEQLKPDPQEVYGVIALPISDGMKLHNGEIDSVSCRSKRYDEVNGTWCIETRNVTRKDFIQRIQRYYLTIHIMAERLMEGRFPLAIS